MKPDLTTIQWVKCFCGPEFYRYITIVSSAWDRLSEDDFEDEWPRMTKVLQESCITEILDPAPVDSRRYHGGGVYHHSIKGGVADEKDAPLHRLSMKKNPLERAAEIRAMIASRYKESPQVKLQVSREMEANVPWDMTEAAKVLKEMNPSSIRLKVKDDFVRVVRANGTEQEKAVVTATATAVPGSSPESAPQLQREEPHLQLKPPTPSKESVKVKKDNHKPGPEAKVRPATKGDHDPSSKPQDQRHHPQTSWLDRLLFWFGIAKDAAVFFKEARTEIEMPQNAWGGIWGSFRNWWYGPLVRH